MKRLIVGLALLMMAGHASAQALLTGQISDRQGEAMPSASVVVLETKQGTAANENGVYRFENLQPGEYTLEVSFVGYKDEKRKIKIQEGIAKAILHVQMTKQIFELTSLTIKATRAAENSPFTYANLAKEKIQEKNLGQDVPFLLRWTPSAVVTSDAGTGFGYTSIRIRGTDPTRINVTINGIPLNDSESQAVFWVDLPDIASSVDDIQIQRGVGTSTNGAGAFGASINMNTGNLHKEAYATFSGTGGSFDTWKATAQFGSGLINKKFTLDGRLSRTTSDGYIERGRADLKSFFLSGAYVGKNSLLRLNVFSGQEVTYQSWCGVPAQYLGDPKLRTFNPCGTEKPGLPHDNEVDDYTQTHYQLLYNHQLDRNWNVNLAAHYTKGSGFFEQYKADQDFADYLLENVTIGNDTITKTDLIRRRWLDNDFYGGIWSLNYIRTDNRLQLTFGGAWNKYLGGHFGKVIWAEFASNGTIGHRYYNGDATKKDFNVFGKASYQLTPFLTAFADLQYRRVNYSTEGTGNDLRAYSVRDDLNFFNPKAGLFYALNDNSQLYASFAVANREPNRDDYVDAPNGVKPKSERLYNTEIGFRQKWKKAALNVNFYHMQYKDQLVLTGQINDVGAPIKTNVPDSYRLGVEIVGGMEVTPHISLQGNATFSRNKVKAFTEFIDTYDANYGWLGQEKFRHENTDLSFSPDLIVGGELKYEVFKRKQRAEKQNLSFSLSGKHVGSQFIDNTSDGNAKLAAYFFSDFQIRYGLRTKLFKEISLTFMVRNVFDEQYAANAWLYRFNFPGDASSYPNVLKGGGPTHNMIGYYPQAGRNFLAGLEVKF